MCGFTYRCAWIELHTPKSKKGLKSAKKIWEVRHFCEQASFSWKINFTLWIKSNTAKILQQRDSRFRVKVVHLQSCYTIFSWLQIGSWGFRVIQWEGSFFDVENSVDIFWSLLQCVGKKMALCANTKQRRKWSRATQIFDGHVPLPSFNFCFEKKKGFGIYQERFSYYHHWISVLKKGFGIYQERVSFYWIWTWNPWMTRLGKTRTCLSSQT